MKRAELTLFLYWVKEHFTEDGDQYLSLDTTQSYSVEELVNLYTSTPSLN